MAEYPAMMADKKDGDGRQEAVRKGNLPDRELITGSDRYPKKGLRHEPQTSRLKPAFIFYLGKAPPL